MIAVGSVMGGRVGMLAASCLPGGTMSLHSSLMPFSIPGGESVPMKIMWRFVVVVRRAWMSSSGAVRMWMGR